MLSMTGYGEAECDADGLRVRVEIRSVNNRHLKLTSRLPDFYQGVEGRVESLVKKFIRRGTVQLNLVVRHEATADDYQINEPILKAYADQLIRIGNSIPNANTIQLESLLALPGVVTESMSHQFDLESEWPLVESTLNEALQRHHHMREQEGTAMAADLRTNCGTIGSELDSIEARAPHVIESYQQRLVDRINALLKEHDLTVDPSAVVREVGVFADRVDISEEVVRLRSHLEQFDLIMTSETAAGRKLEFLIQEMLRETNTIGSKANDADIARHVVNIKTNIERLREMIQNVE